MKNVVLIFVVILLLVCRVSAQTGDESYGLVLKGKVTDVEIEKGTGFVRFFVNIDVELTNQGDEPVILIKPKDNYWLGGWSFYINQNDTKSIFSDGHWESTTRSDKYRKLAEKLDVKTPPAELTKILKQNESWSWKDRFVVFFEAEKGSSSARKTWKEMSEISNAFWIRYVYEMLPWNAENFKPKLFRRLQKRWRQFGILPVDKDSEEKRFSTFYIASEPMLVDFGQAKPKPAETVGSASQN